MGWDTEYEQVWSDDVRYLYDERIGILTDGCGTVTPAMEKIARRQARLAHISEVSERASRFETRICGAW